MRITGSSPVRSEAASRPRLLAAAAGGIFMFGVVMALLGAILLPLAARLNLSAARSGDIFLAMNFGIFLALLASGPAMDRFGVRPVLLASALLLTGGLLGLAGSGSLPALVVCVFLIGIGGGGLNTGANTLVSDAYADERGPALNLLGVFFGFGAVALPFTIGAISERFTLAQILACAAVLPLACAFAYIVLRFPAAREARSFSLRQALGVARNPQVLLFAFLLFFQSGNEFTMGGWISTFLARETGATARFATLTLAGYFLAMMLARFAAVKLLRRMRDNHLVIVSGALAAMATGLLLVSRTPAAACACAVIIGAAYAPVYPTTLGMAGDRFPRFAGTVFSVLFSIALIGGMSFPWAAGHIAQAAGYRAGLAIPLLGACGMTLMSLVILRVSARSPEAENPPQRL